VWIAVRIPDWVADSAVTGPPDTTMIRRAGRPPVVPEQHPTAARGLTVRLKPVKRDTDEFRTARVHDRMHQARPDVGLKPDTTDFATFALAPDTADGARSGKTSPSANGSPIVPPLVRRPLFRSFRASIAVCRSP
jgi:hypothetical protein